MKRLNLARLLAALTCFLLVTSSFSALGQQRTYSRQKQQSTPPSRFGGQNPSQQQATGPNSKSQPAKSSPGKSNNLANPANQPRQLTKQGAAAQIQQVQPSSGQFKTSGRPVNGNAGGNAQRQAGGLPSKRTAGNATQNLPGNQAINPPVIVQRKPATTNPNLSFRNQPPLPGNLPPTGNPNSSSGGSRVRPQPGGNGPGRNAANASESGKAGRTAIEVMGEEMFKQYGLPDEARNMELSDALNLGKQQLVREKFGIPKEETRNMSAEDMLKVIGELQFFEANEQVSNPEFWKDTRANGFDSAMGPVIRDKLGVPKGVLDGAPASEVLKDAGELQELELEFGDANNWKLIDDFQKGKMTGDQLADRVNKPHVGKRNSGVGNVGGGNSGNRQQGAGQPLPGIEGPDSSGLGGMPPAGHNSGGQKSSVNSPAGQPNTPNQRGPAGPPAGSATGGNSAPSTGSESSGPPNSGAGSSGGTTPGNGGAGGSKTGQQNSIGSPAGGGLGGVAKSDESDDDGIVVEGSFAGSGSYVVITHNADGSYTADVVQLDENGNETVVQSETYTDSDGDGVYRGNKGGESESKPNQGIYQGTETDSGTTYMYESNSTDSNDSSSASDDGSTDSADDDDADVDTTDVDKYTPDPESGNMADLYNNVELMKSLYQLLSEEKFALGKGGKDSTPNPMSETMSGKKYPVDYKSMISRPVDGSSTSPTGNVQELIGQVQDPNAIQGGVIDPKKD
jgi:hypothetical protein